MKVSHDAALKSMNAAAVKLNEARDELEKEQTAHMQLRMQLLLRELARYANAVFAVGPAWALLKTIMVVPKGSSGKVHSDDEAANERMRKKLSAYADDEFMLQYVRLAIMAGIVQYEIDNPHDVRAGAELDGPELRSLMATNEKALFEACLAAASKRTA